MAHHDLTTGPLTFYRLLIPLTLLALAAGSCSAPPENAGAGAPPVAASAAPPPTPSAPVSRPTVALPDGTEITIELAITPDELAQGLMYRPQLADDRGMLLLFAEERLPNIWMMNTLVALDIIFLDDEGLVVDLVTGAQPCPGEPCPRFVPKTPARAVLEIAAGGAERHGVAVGAVLAFTDVPEYPQAD